MTRKNNSEDQLPSNLIILLSEAEKEIRKQIEKGNHIRKLDTATKKGSFVAETEKSNWSKYNEKLLTRMFDNQTIANEYYFSGLNSGVKKETDEKIKYLETLIVRLKLTQQEGKSKSKDIFIVHGRDEVTKESVERFIKKLGLNPIILHKQPNAGRTIIEKFEDYSNVGFAIVLLTPDDNGSSIDEPNGVKRRARQNVIFELGYFIGKVGRENVCALYKEGVEIPSDYQGVLYLPMDTNNGWQLSLAREIKQAGIEIDLNKVI